METMIDKSLYFSSRPWSWVCPRPAVSEGEDGKVKGEKKNTNRQVLTA